MSGEHRWSRSDVPQGCDLFGDEEYVFAVPTGKTTARVYSMLDGRFIGRRDVPEWRQQLVTRGREIICWKVAGDKVELSSFDAISGETAWKHEFASGAAVDVELGRYISVVEAPQTASYWSTTQPRPCRRSRKFTSPSGSTTSN
jgi:hypothetical protein